MKIGSVLLVLLRVSCSVGTDSVCQIPTGMFDGMVVSSNVAEPYYGALCNVSISEYVQRFVMRCLPFYCCDQPCVCGGSSTSDTNNCADPSTVVSLSCYTKYRVIGENRKACCDGYVEDELHVCRSKYNCNASNGGCDQLCRHNVTTDKDYCDCYAGYERHYNGSVASCVDINECAEPSKNHCNESGGGVCINQVPGYTCNCSDGFFLYSNSCLPINCSLSNGGCDQLCHHNATTGKDYCDCYAGYERIHTLGVASCKASYPEASAQTGSGSGGLAYQYIIAIVVGIIGFLLLLLLLILLILWCLRRRQSEKQALAFENVIYGNSELKAGNEPNVYIIPGRVVGGSSLQEPENPKTSSSSDPTVNGTTRLKKIPDDDDVDGLKKAGGPHDGSTKSKKRISKKNSKQDSEEDSGKGNGFDGPCKGGDDFGDSKCGGGKSGDDFDDPKCGGGKSGDDFDDPKCGGGKSDDDLEGAVGYSRSQDDKVAYSFEDLDRPKNNHVTSTDCKVIYDFESSHELRPNEYATALTAVNVPTDKKKRAVNEYAQSMIVRAPVNKPTLYMLDDHGNDRLPDTEENEPGSSEQAEDPVNGVAGGAADPVQEVGPSTPGTVKPPIARKPTATEYANADEMSVGTRRMTTSDGRRHIRDDGGYAEIRDVEEMQ